MSENRHVNCEKSSTHLIGGLPENFFESQDIRQLKQGRHGSEPADVHSDLHLVYDWLTDFPSHRLK